MKVVEGGRRAEGGRGGEEGERGERTAKRQLRIVSKIIAFVAKQAVSNSSSPTY